MKFALVKNRTMNTMGEPRTVAQMGQIGIALHQFVKSKGKLTSWDYEVPYEKWDPGWPPRTSMTVRREKGMLCVEFDSGRKKYYRYVSK